ncbi:AraC family transcriptional regulator [Sporomusa malonica]|nr:AraC family transcriptional regulator [Sporomusa malonica]
MKQLSGRIHFYDFRKTFGLELIRGRHVRHNFSRHTHRTLCIGVVELGVRFILCRGERYEVIPGQVFVIPPDEAHSCGSGGEPHTYHLFLITSDLLNMILPKNEKDSYIIKNLVFDDRRQFAQLLNLYTVLTSTETSFCKQSALISTIGEVVEYCADIAEDLRISNNQYDSVKRAQNFIETHYEDSFSLGDIARSAYLSPYYLIRVFNQVIGIPPHIYQQQVRIRHAKGMLAHGISISEVAFKTGFSDQSHFSNTFKKLVGITPGEFIKSI